ncbi:CDP-alcohol phosphatidyltransferase family protein [Roseburia hominis]
MEEKKKAKVFTIPNVLSALRIVLAFAFLAIFFREMENQQIYLNVILLVSAVSDALDGKIARRFDMVTELGKILDPIADKLTQIILLICMVSRYPAILPVLVLFLIKEITVAVSGGFVIWKTGVNGGAKWYGKLSTAVFYVVMLFLIVFPQIPERVAEIMIFVSGGFILFAFNMYMRLFVSLLKKHQS